MSFSFSLVCHWQRIAFSCLADVEQFWIVYWTPWCCSTEALVQQMLPKSSLWCYHRHFCFIELQLAYSNSDEVFSVLKMRNLPMERLWTDNKRKLSTEFCKTSWCQDPSTMRGRWDASGTYSLFLHWLIKGVC